MIYLTFWPLVIVIVITLGSRITLMRTFKAQFQGSHGPARRTLVETQKTSSTCRKEDMLTSSSLRLFQGPGFIKSKLLR